VKPGAIEHIETAFRNRDLSRLLLQQGAQLGLQPPPFEWVTVVAFYAAVHYVNAFLWEQLGIMPSSHTERTGYVASVSPLTSCRIEYRQLNHHGWSARYAPGFRVQEQQARALLDGNLAHVEGIVCASLGIAPT
jgi:hypothetical protein